jgi:hypothetical protein
MNIYKASIRTVLSFTLLFLILNATQMISLAQEASPRYMIMVNQLAFQRVDTLPYEIIGPMCWNEVEGWCDAGMEDGGHRLVYLFDFELDRHGVVMQNDAGCWIWWFLPSYGSDNNPHIAEHYWIVCPEQSS